MVEGKTKAINNDRESSVPCLQLLRSVFVCVCVFFFSVCMANFFLSLIMFYQCPVKAGLLLLPSRPPSLPSVPSRSSLLSLLCIFYSLEWEGEREGGREGIKRWWVGMYRVCVPFWCWRDSLLLLLLLLFMFLDRRFLPLLDVIFLCA